MARRPVYQFKITLLDTHPVVWRRVQISDLASFLDLHAVIQDAMGWHGCHLYEFSIRHPDSNKIERIGIPDDEFDHFDAIKSSEEVKMRDYFNQGNTQCGYVYDFGDSWEHLIEFEGVHDKIDGKKYPLCLDGERACPPEDVGGIPGFEAFVEIMQNKKHPEHTYMREWYGQLFDPAKFDAKKVRFYPSKHKNNFW